MKTFKDFFTTNNESTRTIQMQENNKEKQESESETHNTLPEPAQKTKTKESERPSIITKRQLFLNFIDKMFGISEKSYTFAKVLNK